MVEKGPGMIDDEVRSVLKMAACHLHLKRWDRMNITSDVCEGIITTKWNTYAVGSRSGVLFRSQVKDESGKDYFVNFLLNEDDLRRGAEVIREMEERGDGDWVTGDGRIPVEELYRFYDLHRTAKKLH
jgi:hypothetical protein